MEESIHKINHEMTLWFSKGKVMSVDRSDDRQSWDKIFNQNAKSGNPFSRYQQLVNFYISTRKD